MLGPVVAMPALVIAMLVCMCSAGEKDSDLNIADVMKMLLRLYPVNPDEAAFFTSCYDWANKDQTWMQSGYFVTADLDPDDTSQGLIRFYMKRKKKPQGETTAVTAQLGKKMFNRTSVKMGRCEYFNCDVCVQIKAMIKDAIEAIKKENKESGKSK